MGDHNPYDEELRRRLTAAAHSAAGRTTYLTPRLCAAKRAGGRSAWRS